MTQRKTAQEALFETEDVERQAKLEHAKVRAMERGLGPGPVYQGVCKELRYLLAKGKKHAGREPLINEDEHAGTIASARALARAIDKATGHNLTGYHVNGRDLAPMQERLDALMSQLRPGNTDTDPLMEWIKAPEEDPSDDPAPAHPQE